MKLKTLPLLAALAFYGCSSEEPVVTPPQTPEPQAIVDPFYEDINEFSTLEDYWDLFTRDAIRSGKADPGQDKEVIIFFGSEPDFASGITPDHAGRAYSICKDGQIQFEIIQHFWEDFSVVQRLYTFYHEAGHARYNYRHPCELGQCTSTPDEAPIMWRSVPSSNTTLEEFVARKNDFFKRDWDDVKYFDCP